MCNIHWLVFCMQSRHNSVLCSVRSLQYALLGTLCAVYSVLCAVCSVQCAVHSVHCALLHLNQSFFAPMCLSLREETSHWGQGAQEHKNTKYHPFTTPFFVQLCSQHPFFTTPLLYNPIFTLPFCTTTFLNHPPFPNTLFYTPSCTTFPNASSLT